ncbi:hypothetical protein [Marininema halotolerans]|uniref:Uncharacterized protein n=1 Tax=Marininema halotolerans TaxID=1155944 RepID=A0A1I6PZR0_9BACL|nr:hypothetical protein [Marininema halotolerans]SFS45560.1 hypothetical protein SAMN05444972_102239 [Marininema halotolerans]
MTSANRIEVIVDVDSLAMYSSGNIVGDIFITEKMNSFPDQYWFDFPIIILGWWNRAVERLSKAKIGSTEILYFMDGPFRVNAAKIENKKVKLSFLKYDRVEVFTSIVDMAYLIEQLLNASRKLIRKINNKGWSSEDIEELRRSAKNLKELAL